MVLHHQDADGGGSGLGREQGGWGQRVAWGLTGGIPAPAPLWGVPPLDECPQRSPLSPASVSPPDAPDTHLAGRGGFGGPSFRIPRCRWAAEPLPAQVVS